MDYLDAMIEAYNKEMGLWKITLCENNAYEIARGSLLLYHGPEEAGKPHLKYEAFNKHRHRAAMEAAYNAAKDHSPELNLHGWCSENLYVKKQEKSKIDWLALNREGSGR